MPLVITSRGNTTIYPEGLAVPVGPSPSRREDKSHGASYGVVYANDLAREALASDGRVKFPVGSTIVREKLPREDATQPELVAVMIKRAAGFNPKGGDWEFITTDGMLTKVSERQKKGSCLECHSSQAAKDFIFPLPTPTPASRLDITTPPPKFP